MLGGIASTLDPVPRGMYPAVPSKQLSMCAASQLHLKNLPGSKKAIPALTQPCVFLRRDPGSRLYSPGLILACGIAVNSCKAFAH